MDIFRQFNEHQQTDNGQKQTGQHTHCQTKVDKAASSETKAKQNAGLDSASTLFKPAALFIHYSAN